MEGSAGSERTEAVGTGESERPTAALPADRLQTALDASCAALMALEHARAALSEAPRELRRTQRAEAQAIELVHVAIDDLRRSTCGSEGEPLALGFVDASAEETRSDDHPRDSRH